jgi:Thoeris protein ThsB, TIR-like domain
MQIGFFRGSMRTKTYIAFDGDADLMSYRTIQGWSADKSNPFELNDAHELNYARDDSLPESIIAQLQERLEKSTNFLLIIGSETNKNRKGIMQYEIRYALRNTLPIFLVYKRYSTDQWYSSSNKDEWNKHWFATMKPKLPLVLRETDQTEYCLICPFTREVVARVIGTYNHLKLPSHGYTWFS